MHSVRGRCFQIEPAHSPDCRRITLLNQEGTSHHEVQWPIDPSSSAPLPQEGDWIEIEGQGVRILTPNRAAGKTLRWTRHVLDPRRVRGTQVRAQTESGIREFFGQQGYLETRTPLLVRSPGMEPHIRPFRLEDGSYLPHVARIRNEAPSGRRFGEDFSNLPGVSLRALLAHASS